jgi:4-aminobutyrate aminotransferase
MSDAPDPRLSGLKSEGDLNLGPRRAAWQRSTLDEATRTLIEEDARYFLHQSLSTPCLNALQGSQGIYLEDLQGRHLMDFHGNNVHQVGFANSEVIAAVTQQMEELAFCPRRYTNRVAVEAARTLTGLAPGDLNKVLFCPGGTGAIGMALKLARAATGRHKTISMWDSFHGASLDAISVGGERIFRGNAGPLLPGTEHAPPPGEYRCFYDCASRGGCDLKCAEYVEYMLAKEGDVAAVIAEPVRCTPFIPAPDYWRRVRAACDAHAALLIFDEVPICLGRTGRMFACEHYDVVPDMLVLGKGLGGGLFPMAALLARESLDLMPEGALGHYTHEKSPLGCAALLATIRYIQQHGLVEHADLLGQVALTRMRDMMQRHPVIGDVRGLGLLMGIELVTDRATKQPAGDLAEDLMYGAMDRGLSFKVTMGNILTLTPPLTITQEELDRAFDIVDACLTESAGA